MTSSTDSNQLKGRSCHVHILSPPSSHENDEDAAQDFKFIKWNTTMPQPLSAHPSTTSVQLTRPNTTLTKSYNVDGVFTSSSSSDGDDYYQRHIQPKVQVAMEENCNLLVWSFGTRGTGKTRVLFGSNDEIENSNGWVRKIASDINQQFFEKSEHEGNVTVTLSSICVTADDVEQTFDCLCLSSYSSPKPLSRIRQDPSTNEFYLDNTNQIIVQTTSDINQLLQKTRDFGEKVVGKKVHHLVTFTIYKMYANGDVVRFTVQIMDICGAERPSTAPTVTAGNKKSAVARVGRGATRRRAPAQRKKEDKTLRALTRIIDSLSNNDKHVPYRDSKLTRLVSHSFGNENDKSMNVALIGVSAMEESMYDETCAMMEFVNKVRSIENKTNKNVSSYSTGAVVRTNRLLELQQAKQNVITLSEKCGLEANIEAGERLKSSDIELDMSSSMDLVDLRDALAKVESLEVDPMTELVEKSDQWWEIMRSG